MNNFEHYALRHLGISSLNTHAYRNYFDNMVTNYQTPSIVEESEMRATVMSVFDRLMKDRIIFINSAIEPLMASIIKAQLMYLDTIKQENIDIYIDSPGGGVYAGLGIIDTMALCQSWVNTCVNGMAASMASVILGAGKTRTMTRNSRVMLHQSSGGAGGNIQDAKVEMIEWESLNKVLFELLGSYTGKTAEQVMNDSQRDLWLHAKQAIEYGIVDRVILGKENFITKENIHLL